MDTSWRASEFEMTRCLKFTQKVSFHKHCKQIQDKYLYRDIFGDFQPMCDMAKSVSRVVDQVSKASLSRIWLILVLHQVQMNICVMSLLWNKWALSRFPSINKLFGFQSIQARFSSPSLKKEERVNIPIKKPQGGTLNWDVTKVAWTVVFEVEISLDCSPAAMQRSSMLPSKEEEWASQIERSLRKKIFPSSDPDKLYVALSHPHLKSADRELCVELLEDEWDTRRLVSISAN